MVGYVSKYAFVKATSAAIRGASVMSKPGRVSLAVSVRKVASGRLRSKKLRPSSW